MQIPGSSEKPSQLRGLLLGSAGVLLAVFLLYVLGSGPATYYQTRYMNTEGVLGSPVVYEKLRRLYRPLEAGVHGTPLKTPLAGYRGWWSARATAKHPPTDNYSVPAGICFEFGL